MSSPAVVFIQSPVSWVWEGSFSRCKKWLYYEAGPFLPSVSDMNAWYYAITLPNILLALYFLLKILQMLR
jgi:hypothetical protein